MIGNEAQSEPINTRPPTDFRNPLWLVASGWIVPAVALIRIPLQSPQDLVDWILFGLILASILTTGLGAWIALTTAPTHWQNNLGNHLFTAGTIFAWSMMGFYQAGIAIPMTLAVIAGLVAAALIWEIDQAWPYLLFVVPIFLQNWANNNLTFAIACAAVTPFLILYTVLNRQWHASISKRLAEQQLTQAAEQALADRLMLKNRLNDLAIENQTLQKQLEAPTVATDNRPTDPKVPDDTVFMFEDGQVDAGTWVTALYEIAQQQTFKNTANALLHFATVQSHSNWGALFYTTTPDEPYRLVTALDQTAGQLSAEQYQTEIEQLLTQVVNGTQEPATLIVEGRSSKRTSLIAFGRPEAAGTQSLVLVLGRLADLHMAARYTPAEKTVAQGLLIGASGYLFQYQLFAEKEQMRRQDMVLDQVFSEVYRSLTVHDVLQNTAEQIGKAVNSPHVRIRVIPDQGG